MDRYTQPIYVPQPEVEFEALRVDFESMIS